MANQVQELQQKARLAQESGDPEGAEKLYREILQIQPHQISALCALGDLFVNQKQYDEAIDLYSSALRNGFSSKSKAEILISLGKIFLDRYELIQATRTFEQAISLDPQSYRAHTNLGLALKHQSRFEGAERAYRQALELSPDNAGTIYNHLGFALRCQSRFEEATEAYRQAVKLQPNFLGARINLGLSLVRQCKYKEAAMAYEQVLEIAPQCLEAQFARIFCELPIIYQNPQEIIEKRQNYQRYLEQFIKDYDDAPIEKLASAAKVVGLIQPFLLPYQGLNDRQLQQGFGQLMCRFMAARYPQWSRCLPPPNLRPNEKIRIGIVSGYFRKHSVWKIPIKGWVENFDTREFELFAYHTESRQDEETLVARKSFKKFVQGPLTIEQWCQTIEKDNLHLLIFSDFGMDPMTFELGCLRLAPIQLAAAGHPESSGLPTIDYFLSSDLMEPENAEEHYTEQVVRLPNLSIYYSPLPYSPESASRTEIDIANDDVMFWCCQSTFKYLPQHDDVFPRIASKLNNARFVFIENPTKHVTNIFKARLNSAFSQVGLDYREFCRFLPRMNQRKFAGVASLANVFLDSIDWSGHNSALESLVFDLPIVTFPGKFMRGRHSFAILKMMGITETIASSKDEYIDIAVRLGKDPKYLEAMSRKIVQNKDRLYKDLKPVRALEDFLLKLVNKSRQVVDLGDEAELAKADKFIALGQFAAAREIYQQVLSRHPDRPKALLGLAILAQKQGQLLAAENLLNKAVKLQPDLLPAWFALGNLFQAKGQLDDAIFAYRKALELRSDMLPVHNNLAYVLQQTGQLDGAIEHYRQALSLQPNSQEVDVHLANVLHMKSELPDDKLAHYAKLNYDLGINRKQSKDLKSAIVYFQQAISLDPNLAAAHLELGIALRDEQEQLDEALSCFERVRTLKSIRNKEASIEATLYTEMGRTYQVLKRIDRAVEAFHKAVSLENPQYLEAYSRAQAIPNLEDYVPPPIAFDEVEIGGHVFPTISPVSPSENKRPFWSVAIPAVNRPEYFPECLASVLAQWTGEDDMEIVVLDNGSNPPLFDIVNSLGGGIIRYYRFPETIPLQQNWNTLVSLCRGKWIHLLQHDDYILPGFYALLKNSLETCSESIGAAFTGYENINENRKVIFTQEHNLKHFRGVVQDWVNRIGVSCPLSPPSLVIQREAYEKLGGYKLDLPYTCDWEFYKRVASFYDWWHEPGILAHYRQHSNSLTVNLNIGSTSGAAHRRAIEISKGYLPTDLCDEITTKSRRFHNKWCLDRAIIPLKANRLEGAFDLVQEALRIDSSPEGIDRVFTWLTSEKATPLRTLIASRLIKDIPCDASG